MRKAILTILLVISLTGCSSSSESSENSIIGELAGSLAMAVIDSYVESLQYKYPISDELREQQIEKIIKIDVYDRLYNKA